MNKRGLLVSVIILLLLFFDQWLKIYVKCNFSLGEQVSVLGNWFSLHYIENDGIAFGMVFWTRPIGKILLTLFRLVASCGILWIIVLMLRNRENVPFGLLLCTTLIFSGAVGNVIDCIFYGQLFSPSSYYGPAATLFSGEGYAPLLQGRVVDMLQFDLFDIPLGATRQFHFFPAIFNLADAYITTGILMLLVFYYRALSRFISSLEKPQNQSENTTHEE